MSDVGASSYSTGGGGVALEHQYAATLLARMLVGAPCAELGDRVEVSVVRLQASEISPVDDIVLEGKTPDGTTHRASIGVRRDPQLNSSDSASVPLIRAFLQIVTAHWDEVSAGRWTLTLAVAVARQAFQQVDSLAVTARSVEDAPAFAAAVARPGAVNSRTVQRLGHLKNLVEAAAGDDDQLAGHDIDLLLWRLLSSLQVRFLRLEGTDTSDRTHAVSALQSAVTDGTAASADAVFSRLAELTHEYAASGAQVTGAMLRRRLSAHDLKSFGPHEGAWEVFSRLGDLLKQQTGSTISSGPDSVHLEREDAAHSLRLAMEAASSAGGPLVVTGEPDVGKSALVLAACESLGQDGAVTVCLSLRDVRGTVLDLEGLLGGTTLTQFFAGAPTGAVRLLVMDGCEAVLEGQEPLFAELSGAAMRQGLGVVAVTRSDGARFVENVLQRVVTTLVDTPPLETHTVAELAQGERESLATSIPPLGRVLADPKSNWLLGRPGLVDAVLRSGRPVDPDALLCEADVYSAVWNGLILRGGAQPAGAATPEEREAAAVAVARRRLGSQEAPPANAAVRELRSDGVLRAETNAAFSQGPDFSTDLYRDFSLCKLFLFSGWEPLTAHAAPRWTIRAVRLACQARLANPGGRTRLEVWQELVEEFNALAANDGVRWAEVPIEALMTLGDAREAIADLWDVLLARDGLETLLRLAAGRYVKADFGDQFALAPVVEVAFCEGRDLGQRRRGVRNSPQERVEQLVLAWLRGMGHAGRGPDPLRQKVRDTILAQDRRLYDDFAIEALASLGHDLDEAAATWLRRVAAERPSSLDHVPESLGVVLSLSAVNPELLLELTEAYYIEKPEPEDRYGWGGRRGFLDDGIRDSRHGNAFGFGAPGAAWYYGPFYRLLNASPAKTVAFINRMLDQAALFRVTDGPNPVAGDVVWADYEGATLQLTERSGTQHYVGDAHVWSWYRGTSVGPYACMSALLALERLIDALHHDAGIPLATIVDFLLKDCHNLAVPGMLCGFLTRHLGEVGDLLDPFLADVSVWHFETGRVTTERGFSVRDRDADKLVGHDKRQYSPHDIVGWMVVNARVSGNQARQTELEEVGDLLLASAQRQVQARRAEEAEETDESDVEAPSADGSDQYLAMVASWAAEFRAANYEASVVDDGVVIQFERPAELEEVLAPGNQQIQAVTDLYRLQANYALKNETPEQWPVDTLIADIVEARRLVNDSPPSTFAWPENPVVAVAVAAVRAHATGLLDVGDDDLRWAADLVLLGAENPHVDGFSTSSSLFSMGADRASAIAVPLLLLPQFDSLGLDSDRLSRALIALGTSVYDEVRTAFAKGCVPVWQVTCEVDEGGRCKRHRRAWDAVESCLEGTRLGPWEYETQRRQTVTLERPFDQTLPAVPADELLVNRLRMPVVCISAARTVACTADEANALSQPLWDAHLRALDHAWREGYDHLSERHHELVARLFIALAADGDRQVLGLHLQTFASNAHALHSFLHSFATVFSYDDGLRPLLADFWVPTMTVVLDAIEAGASLIDDSTSWYDYAISALLPTPQIESGDLDPDATLNNCRSSWAAPEAFSGVIGRWLTLAKGEPKGAEAVAQFARTAPLEWQATMGLDWLEAIIDGNYHAFSNRTWFVTNWLGELRASGGVAGVTVPRYRRIVDGLAAAGDSMAVALQQLEE